MSESDEQRGLAKAEKSSASSGISITVPSIIAKVLGISAGDTLAWRIEERDGYKYGAVWKLTK